MDWISYYTCSNFLWGPLKIVAFTVLFICACLCKMPTCCYGNAFLSCYSCWNIILAFMAVHMCEVMNQCGHL